MCCYYLFLVRNAPVYSDLSIYTNLHSTFNADLNGNPIVRRKQFLERMLESFCLILDVGTKICFVYFIFKALL